MGKDEDLCLDADPTSAAALLDEITAEKNKTRLTTTKQQPRRHKSGTTDNKHAPAKDSLARISI